MLSFVSCLLSGQDHDQRRAQPHHPDANAAPSFRNIVGRDRMEQIAFAVHSLTLAGEIVPVKAKRNVA